MFENELNQLIKKMVEVTNAMIPINWKDLYIYTELQDGEGETLFYYNSSEEEEKYKYSHDIPEEYNISFSEYMNGFNELMSTSREIHNLLDKNGQEKWVWMTIIVHNQSTLKVEFDYADWLNSSYTSNQRLKYFQYTHLGKIPQNELEMKLFEEMEEFQKKNNS
ncbi:immunity protein YezG family protein [Streptococcus fryi]